LPSKAWTLEDDSEDEEEGKNKVKQEEGEEEKEKTNGEIKPEEEEVKIEEIEVPEKKEEPEEEVEMEDDIDPLDAYMMTVQEEVCKINKGGKVQDSKEKQNAQSGVVIMTGTAKKKDSSKDKGELIEQNQDGLEVDKF